MMGIARLVLILSLIRASAVAVDQCCPDDVKLDPKNNTCTDGGEVFLECSEGYYRLDSIEDDDQFWTLKNGTVMLHDGYEFYEYCMSSITDNGTSREVALVCFDWESYPVQWGYLVLMIISIPFLIITILVYAMIPVLRDLNGKCIIGYMASLAVSYTTIIIRDLQPDLPFELCTLRGAVLYYSTMSTFAWLNTVTFNLWKSVRNKVYQMTDKKLFFVYLAWSVGLPLFLCAIVILLDLIPGSRVKGHFSMFDCWFPDDFGFYTLLYIPMTILIILNMVMFVHCCWILWRGYRDPTQSRIRFLRFKCLFTLRLFLLSGVPWILDVISVSLEEEVAQLKYLWYIFDSINACQGIILFIILVACHKRALRAIHQHRLCGLKWPDSWNEHEAGSVTVSEIDKVAMEQMKENNT